VLKNFTKKITVQNLFLFILFIILLFFLRWNSFTTPFERDEGEYAYSAWIMQHGRMPYENSFLQKPPMIVYTYFLGEVISSDALWPPRLLAVIFILATTFFLYKIADREFGKPAGWITAFVFISIVSSPINSSLAANTEIFMLLPLVGFLYLYILNKDKTSLLTWFFSGVLASLTLLYKPIAFYVLGYIYIIWVLSLWRREKNLPSLLKNLSFVFLGGVIASLFVLLPFLLSDGGKSFWEEVIIFNLYYAKQWGYGLSTLLLNLRVMARSFWLIYVLVVLYLFIKSKDWKFYVGLLFFSLLSVYQTNIRHYYILLMPFLALILTQVIIWLIKQRLVKDLLSNRSTTVLTTLLVLSVLWPVRVQFSKTPEELSLWIYGRDNPFYEAPLVADKLADITDPSDCVFIAGSEPEILFYAKRFSCTKFVITYPLIVESPIREQYQAQVVEEIENMKPKAIVYSNKAHSGLWNEESPKVFINYLDKLIRNNYKLIGGWKWWEEGGWSSNFSQEDIGNSSLLLYSVKN